MTAPRFLFMDIETTGLDPHLHSIIEIGAVVTDANFCVLGDTFQAVLRDIDDPDRRNWDPWCLEQHAKSGLLQEEQWAEVPRDIAAELKAWACAAGVAKTTEAAGASVHFDMGFFNTSRHFSWLQEWISHRYFDVSTLRTVAKLGGFEVQADMVKTKEAAPHRVLGDIALDIQHAKNFLSYVNKLKGEAK